jgi:ABC-2 type transport system permease protein
VYVLWRILVKELLQLRHDRRMIPVMIVGPLMQLLALGFAANTDVQHLPMLLVDLDRTEDSRRLVDAFLGSGYFDLVGVEGSQNAIEPWLIRGEAEIALVIARGYGTDLAGERTAQVQIIADGSNSNSAVVGLGYAARIVAAEGGTLLEKRLERLPEGERPGSTDLRPRVWYNPDLRSRWFYVPAITALTLMLLTLILPSMAVVREREIGTLEQISVTPIRPWQLILGKLLPFGLIGLLNVCLVTAAARVVFGVPFRGSFLLLLLLTLPFLVAMLGLGLFASTLVSTQQQAMMTSIFLLMVPMIYLSGLIFPIENMPHGIQVATYAIPLRYYNHVIRGLYLKASGLDVLWREGLILAGFGVLNLVVASLRFRKSLD